MAKKKNFYAVKIGFDKETNTVVENQIYQTWAETERVVAGVSKKVHGVSPEYAGFVTRQEAEAFLEEEAAYIHKGDNTYPKDALHCYLDGSFSKELTNYSFGVTFVKDNQVVGTKKGVGKNKEAIAMQQIAGELLGAMHSLLFTKEHGYSKAVLFFDYKGVANHALGVWKRDNVFSQTYYDWMQKFFADNPQIEVIFCKVDAHTGDDFNEISDGLAKVALGIKPDAISVRHATKYGVADALALS